MENGAAPVVDRSDGSRLAVRLCFQAIVSLSRIEHPFVLESGWGIANPVEKGASLSEGKSNGTPPEVRIKPVFPEQIKQKIGTVRLSSRSNSGSWCPIPVNVEKPVRNIPEFRYLWSQFEPLWNPLCPRFVLPSKPSEVRMASAPNGVHVVIILGFRVRAKPGVPIVLGEFLGRLFQRHSGSE